MLHEGEHPEGPGNAVGIAGVAAGRERFLGVVVERDGQAQLLEIVGARHTVARLAGCLYGRQEQAHERANDRNDHQQFHQRESPWQSSHSVCVQAGIGSRTTEC